MTPNLLLPTDNGDCDSSQCKHKLLVGNIEEVFALLSKAVPLTRQPLVYDKETGEKLKRNVQTLLQDRTGLHCLDSSYMSARKVYPWPKEDLASILRANYPHFEEVISLLERRQALCRLVGLGMSFPPILLAGPPGVGKTQFANELAKLMSVPFKECSMGSQTAGWILSGIDLSWSGGKPGRIFETLADGDAFNPIVLLDELDKVSTQPTNAPRPDAALYTLLEAESAKRFKDEAIPVGIDASGIAWIATVNDLSRVDEAILSRFRVFNIPVPTPEQQRQVAQSVYGSILATEEWGGVFECHLSADVLDALADMEEGARLVKAKLTDALGIAAMAGRSWIEVQDLPVAKKAVKRSIGFV